MNLQEKFNTEPPSQYLIEIMDVSTPTGIYYIPILYVKEMLSQDFLAWEVEHIQIKEFMWGQSCMINCSLILVLHSVYEETENGTKIIINKYPGGFTFNISRYKNNEDWAAIGISECIKNAAKNIGRKYGMYLNQGRVDAQTLEGISSLTAPLKTPQPSNPTTKKAIHSITKLNK